MTIIISMRCFEKKAYKADKASETESKEEVCMRTAVACRRNKTYRFIVFRWLGVIFEVCRRLLCDPWDAVSYKKEINSFESRRSFRKFQKYLQRLKKTVVLGVYKPETLYRYNGVEGGAWYEDIDGNKWRLLTFDPHHDGLHSLVYGPDRYGAWERIRTVYVHLHFKAKVRRYFLREVYLITYDSVSYYDLFELDAQGNKMRVLSAKDLETALVLVEQEYNIPMASLRDAA